MRSLLHYLIVLIIKASGEDQISNGTNLKVGSKPKPVASTTVRSKPMQVAPTYVRIKPKPVASTTVKSEPWPDASTTERSELGPDVSNYAKIKLKAVASTNERILPVPVASTTIRILPVSVASTRNVILGKRILVSGESDESKKIILGKKILVSDESERKKDLYQQDSSSMKNEIISSQADHYETNERPYKCGTCERSFAYQENLKYHRRIRRKIQYDSIKYSYKCEYCYEYFETKNKLLDHKCSHKDSHESFSCKVCNETFAWQEYLVIHERIHTEYKIFTCESCNKVFNNEYAYVLHKKSVHKDSMQEKETSHNFVSITENETEDQGAKIKEEIVIETVENIEEDPLAVPEDEESYGDGLKAHIMVTMQEKESLNDFISVNENIICNHPIKTVDPGAEIKEEIELGIEVETVKTIEEDHPVYKMVIHWYFKIIFQNKLCL